MLTPRCGRESRQGVPTFTPAEHDRRRDRLALLRRRGGDERQAPGAYRWRMSEARARSAPSAGREDDDRRARPSQRNDDPKHPRPPDPRTVAASRGPGRTGYYDEEHVARIDLTREMQADGLNLEAIRRVLESTGGNSKEMVDFARAVRAPFEDETPEIFESADFAGPGR